MSCAYCGERSDYTKEHIISSSVLDLFPECFATIDNARGKAYASDPVVKDVCSVCNNQKLSYIDNYAREFIEQYFVVDYSEDAILDFQYNYVLLQKVLLKYAFNDLRSHHGDTSFFTKDVREFLLNETLATPLSNVSILAGLAINTSPVPDYFFGNLKLQWAEKPVFLSNSMVEFINYSTGKIFPRKEMEIESMEGLVLSYVFRFNSGQFILLCWDESNPKTKDSQTIARLQYPYTLLPENEGHAKIERCTSEITYHRIGLIDVKWGQGIMDEITTMRRLANPRQRMWFLETTKKWKEEEKQLAKEHPRK